MASVSWTTLFNESPTIADRVRNTPVFIQQTRAAVQERLAVEHCLDVTDGGSQNDHGKHLQGSARVFVQASAPTAATVTPDNADYSTGRVYLNSTNGRLSIYRDSAWNTTVRVSNADLADSATNATNANACSGNAATATLATNATNAYACSGNSATATTATNASVINGFVWSNASGISGISTSAPGAGAAVPLANGVYFVVVASGAFSFQGNISGTWYGTGSAGGVFVQTGTTRILCTSAGILGYIRLGL